MAQQQNANKFIILHDEEKIMQKYQIQKEKADYLLVLLLLDEWSPYKIISPAVQALQLSHQLHRRHLQAQLMHHYQDYHETSIPLRAQRP